MPRPWIRYRAFLGRYLAPQRARVALLALLLLGSVALELLNPQILRYFVDTAFAGGAVETLAGAGVLFIGVALLYQGLSIAATYVSETVAWTATNTLRLDLTAHCLRLDLSFHKARTPGELIERIDGDVTALANFFSQFVVNLLGNLLLLAGVLALLWTVDWRVGLALTLFAAGALAMLLRIGALAAPRWAAVREANATFYGFLGEQLAGTEDIRANGATAYVLRRFAELLRAWLPLERQAGLAGYALWMTTIGVFAAGTALALALGGYLWSTGALTVGTVYLIFYYTGLLARPLEQIRTQLLDMQKAAASIGRVEELLATPSRLADGPGQPLPAGAPGVTFEHVSFGYDAEAPVLHDVTFHLPAGQVLGLLGRTGSGKTTLARLLVRLYDPAAGRICLGGVPLAAARPAEVRRRVGLVTQDVQLFEASVRDNLTFFDPAVHDARILAVLEEVGLRRWYDTLPAGLATELAAGGGLSAGEAQLLAFARIFLADPGLVILDEASSRLDPATEAAIDRAVRRLLAGRTAIIIAHRLPTVARADRIMILDEGRILEEGERGRLAGDPAAHFHHLLQTGLAEVLA